MQDSTLISPMQEVTIHDKTFRKLIEADKIQQRVHEIALEINEEYKGRKPLFLGVLNGAFLFAADLFKGISLECEISFIRVSSYDGTSSSGQVGNTPAPTPSKFSLNEVPGTHAVTKLSITDQGLWFPPPQLVLTQTKYLVAGDKPVML